MMLSNVLALCQWAATHLPRSFGRPARRRFGKPTAWVSGEFLESRRVMSNTPMAAAITPSVTINDVSVTEGNSGTQTVRFTLQLSQPVNHSVSVKYATANETALAGRDFNSASGTVTFAAHQTSKTIAIKIRGDRVAEPTETLVVNLSRPRGVTIGDGQGVCTIIDNDAPPPTQTGTVLIDETFEDGVINGFDEIVQTNGATGVVKSGDSYGAGNKYLEITYPRDESNVLLNKYGLAVDSLEVSFAQKLPDGIPISQGSSFAGLKQTRLFHSRGLPEERNLNVQHELHYTRPGAEGAGPNGRYELNFYFEHQGRVQRVPIEVSPSRWMHTRYFVKFNTPGQADGVFKLWIDGQQKLNLTDLIYTPDVVSRPDGLFFGGNFSHSGTNPDRPFRRYLDDLKVVVNGATP